MVDPLNSSTFLRRLFGMPRHGSPLAGAVVMGLALLGTATSANAGRRSALSDLVSSYADGGTTQLAAVGTLEVGFSPDEGSERLVVKLIDSAQHELLVLCYSFTSRPVVEAIVRARHRGVVVRLVADEKENVTDDRRGSARAALGALVNAGAEVRTISVYAISHDKTMVADRNSLELGSFNYSAAAAHKNSENVLVNWNNPALAALFAKHFERNYRQGKPYTQGY